MTGMDEVGRLFNNNELIVAEVLQSAEAMKAAVAYLEPFMEKAESRAAGKVILATVKGDVHDIGKNLVEIILANNGFEVIEPRDQGAARGAHPGRSSEHQPDIVGLSGLLVKSAQQMVVTAQEASRRAGHVPAHARRRRRLFPTGLPGARSPRPTGNRSPTPRTP